VLTIPLARRAALPAVALVLTLSACGSNSDPLAGASAPPQPKSSATASSGTSAAPSAPTAPAAAGAHTDDGAIAFVKYYFETLINSAYTTGNVQPLALATDANCVVCRATIGDAAYFTVTGDRAQGGKVSVSSVKVVGSDSDQTTVSLSYSKDKLSEINPDGSTAFSTDAANGVSIRAQVKWDSGAKMWRMAQILNNAAEEPTSTPTP
jgi:hypothetical protein